jgi:methyltransferase family protein/C-methyltransferase-like protein
VSTAQRCPVCGGGRVLDTVRRERLPAMQNYVHRTRESALSAASGAFILAACRSCGFAWNRRFDADRLEYDQNYDNAVPSQVMREYYATIASYLAERYVRDGGLVLDVGCGNGAFLRTLCELAPAARGLGVDPALETSSVSEDGRLTLVRDVFSPDALDESPALVVSRHVLEHIPQPVEFLRLVADGAGRFGPRPCFFEVPDLEWIVEHRTFWDFCYEHCNYFTASSFTRSLEAAGLEPTNARTGFNGQYLWIEGVTSGEAGALREDGEGIAGRLQAYAAEEPQRMAAARELLRRNRDAGRANVVWGMATKGVMFSVLVDPEASLVDLCVDANPNKQDCYVPLTAQPIRAPEALAGLGRPVSVLVMNENYRDEIELTCAALGVDAAFANASADLR